MISLLEKIFFDNWQRKLIALILAMIIWIVITHSLSGTRVFHEIPIRIINIPAGKIIDGMHPNHTLNNKISLTITGNSTILESLSEMDLEVVLNAADKGDEWVANITKNNLVCLNPEIDISKSITKITHKEFILKLTNLITDKIPVSVLTPIGEAPQGYQFLDVWPYKLYVTVSGPESVIKKIKNKELKLRFNLNDISTTELDALANVKNPNPTDEITFFVPTSWKKVIIPSISDTPIEIDDPHAKFLRIDFIHKNTLPLNRPIPITLFFPLQYDSIFNPNNLSICPNDFIKEKNGIFYVEDNLLVKGVNKLFLETVQDMLEIVVVVLPKEKREKLPWYVQCIYPSELEDIFITKMISEEKEKEKEKDDDETDEIKDVNANLKEEYLRNRFRSYMDSFRLYTKDGKKISLKIEVQNKKISILPITSQ
jgi:hypothetical protein